MWRYTMRYKKLLFADFICVFGFILIELGLPTILARMIDKGIIPRDMDYLSARDLDGCNYDYWCRNEYFAGVLWCQNYNKHCS